MPQLKLKIKKVGSKNPQTKVNGFAARVKNNGTAGFDDIVKDAGRNTTMHKAELRMAFELCMDSVTEMLKQGYISWNLARWAKSIRAVRADGTRRKRT